MVRRCLQRETVVCPPHQADLTSGQSRQPASPPEARMSVVSSHNVSVFLVLQTSGTGCVWNAATKAARVARQISAITRKILVTKNSGLNATTIATNPAAQKYWRDRTAC